MTVSLFRRYAWHQQRLIYQFIKSQNHTSAKCIQESLLSILVEQPAGQPIFTYRQFFLMLLSS